MKTISIVSFETFAVGLGHVDDLVHKYTSVNGWTQRTVLHKLF